MATYKAIERLGQGGMAEVWRGEMTTEGGVRRQVALKFILPHLARDQELLAEFRAEAQLSMRLSHANVVQVFDFGQLDGRWFLAMEWVEGTSLWHVLQKAKEKGARALAPALAAQLVCAALEGLHHAHTRVQPDGSALELVHRDVSPDNVLVSWDGQVKVSDFGIARAALASRPQTKAGISKGKLEYGAPEQARGEPLDARADVYAAGVMLWELVTGTNPLERNALRVASGAEKLPPFDSSLAGPAFAALLDTAVAPEPSRRFRSAKAFGDALAAWARTQPARTGAMELMAGLFPQHAARPVARPDTTAPGAPARSRLPLVALAALPVFGVLAWALWPQPPPVAPPPQALPRPPPVPAPVAVAAPAAPQPAAAQPAPARPTDGVEGAPVVVHLDSAVHGFEVTSRPDFVHYDNRSASSQRIQVVGRTSLFAATTSEERGLLRVEAFQAQGVRVKLQVPAHQSVHLFRLGQVSEGKSSFTLNPKVLEFDVPAPALVSRDQRFVISEMGPGPWLISAHPMAGPAPLGVLLSSTQGRFRTSSHEELGPSVFLNTNTVVEFEGGELWLSIPRVGKEHHALEVRVEQSDGPQFGARPSPLERFRGKLEPPMPPSEPRKRPTAAAHQAAQHEAALRSAKFGGESLARGQLEEASRSFRGCAQKDPTLPDCVEGLIKTSIRRKDVEGARRQARDYVERFPRGAYVKTAQDWLLANPER